MQLSIEAMAYGPEALAHTNEGKTVFVEGAVPGDVVEAQVIHESKRFARARVTRLLEPSPKRVEPPCPYSDQCSGCPWAALDYAAQLLAKQTNIEAALTRVAHIEIARVNELLAPIVAPGPAWGYRNKIELALGHKSDRLVVGFHGKDAGSVVPIERCPLLPARFLTLPKKVAGALRYGSQGRGLAIQRVGIRASERTGAIEVALWTAPSAFPRSLMGNILAQGTQASGVVRVMTKGPQKARKIAGFEVLKGQGRFKESLDGHLMSVSAPSFFQVNTPGAEKLIELVMRAAHQATSTTNEALSEMSAWDLFCGAGTFTLPLARRLGWVDAVESFGPAVRDLRYNLTKAHLKNVDAIGGDAAREMPAWAPQLIVCDPPRAGLSQAAIEGLNRVGQRPEPQALIYVSCDPQTLARDIERMESSGSWHLASLTPVDLFPQTYHVECVALLTTRAPLTSFELPLEPGACLRA